MKQEDEEELWSAIVGWSECRGNAETMEAARQCVYEAVISIADSAVKAERERLRLAVYDCAQKGLSLSAAFSDPPAQATYGPREHISSDEPQGVQAAKLQRALRNQPDPIAELDRRVGELERWKRDRDDEITHRIVAMIEDRFERERLRSGTDESASKHGIETKLVNLFALLDREREARSRELWPSPSSVNRLRPTPGPPPQRCQRTACPGCPECRP